MKPYDANRLGISELAGRKPGCRSVGCGRSLRVAYDRTALKVDIWIAEMWCSLSSSNQG